MTAKSTTLTLEDMGRNAKTAFRQMGSAPVDKRNAAILSIARLIEAGHATLQAANALDIDVARGMGKPDAFIDRMTLTEKRLSGMVADLNALASLPDPLAEAFDHRTMPSGIRIHRQRTPLGVMGVIYESRPNVTIDVASLAIKTSNAAILRGGKETINSNAALMALVHQALAEHGLPASLVQFVAQPDRALVGKMLHLNDYIDVIIPRGGNSLHQFCRANSTIPVITGGIGICHLFVDESADLDASIPLIHNAKTQRPSVCNSLDTLLVHENIAADFLPRVVVALAADGVSFRAEPRALALVDSHEAVEAAGDDDFDIEWLSLVLGLKVVAGIEEAIAHINAHSTFHSDGILSHAPANISLFVNEVDSAGVFINASTRFNDGSQLGLGAEVAVSTQRLHARGPMGLPELTTYKWVVEGDYTVRQ